jgi:hypothetical protein
MIAKFEEIVFDSVIWVLKYETYHNGVKYTDCHGWYKNEADAIKAMHTLQGMYRIEKVCERRLMEIK